MSKDLVPAGGAVVPAAPVVPAVYSHGPLPGTTPDMARKLARETAKKPQAKTPLQVQSDQERDDTFIKAFVAKGHSPAQAKDAIEALNAIYVRDDEIEAHFDKQDLAECTAALRERWGSSYSANKTAALTAFRALPVAIQDALESGTLADGTLALHTEVAWCWLHSLTTRPSRADGGGGESLQTELSNLRKMIGDRSSPYWKGRDAARNQARYKELIELTGGR